jgi:hypothetical protein
VILPESVTVVVTLKVKPLLAFPPTVTTTGPAVAVAGTGTEMLVSLQLVGDALTPLKVMVLLPCVAPKVVPVIVSGSPAAPDPGAIAVIFGLTVKLTELLATPATVVTTEPEVAPVGTGTLILVLLQLEGVALVPLKVIVLLP